VDINFSRCTIDVILHTRYLFLVVGGSVHTTNVVEKTLLQQIAKKNGMNAEKRHTFLEMCGKPKKAKFGKFEMIFLILKTLSTVV
jgi:hypothetical protein